MNYYQRKAYPKELRLVTYIDPESGEQHVFVTNNFTLAARTIADLTKCRHSLHELTRIIGEILLDTSNLIETLTIPFEAYIRVKRKQVQLSLF